VPAPKRKMLISSMSFAGMRALCSVLVIVLWAQCTAVHQQVVLTGRGTHHPLGRDMTRLLHCACWCTACAAGWRERDVVGDGVVLPRSSKAGASTPLRTCLRLQPGTSEACSSCPAWIG
jgi:hypothetical protein